MIRDTPMGGTPAFTTHIRIPGEGVTVENLTDLMAMLQEVDSSADVVIEAALPQKLMSLSQSSWQQSDLPPDLSEPWTGARCPLCIVQPSEPVGLDQHLNLKRHLEIANEQADALTLPKPLLVVDILAWELRCTKSEGVLGEEWCPYLVKKAAFISLDILKQIKDAAKHAHFPVRGPVAERVALEYMIPAIKLACTKILKHPKWRLLPVYFQTFDVSTLTDNDATLYAQYDFWQVSSRAIKARFQIEGHLRTWHTIFATMEKQHRKDRDVVDWTLRRQASYETCQIGATIFDKFVADASNTAAELDKLTVSILRNDPGRLCEEYDYLCENVFNRTYEALHLLAIFASDLEEKLNAHEIPKNELPLSFSKAKCPFRKLKADLNRRDKLDTSAAQKHGLEKELRKQIEELERSRKPAAPSQDAATNKGMFDALNGIS